MEYGYERLQKQKTVNVGCVLASHGARSLGRGLKNTPKVVILAKWPTSAYCSTMMLTPKIYSFFFLKKTILVLNSRTVFMIIRDFLEGVNGLPISRFGGFSSILDCIRGSIYKGNITGNWCRVAKPSFGRFGWSNVINSDQATLCETYLTKKKQI